MKEYFTCFFIFCAVGLQAQFLQIEDGMTAGMSPEELAAQILQNDDFQVLSVSYTGGAAAVGSFEGIGDSPVGIDHGMVLSSGTVAAIPGAGAGFANAGIGTLGDADLDQLSAETGPTQDAAAVIVEFIPFTDTLVVDFVFGSEEYPEFSCSSFNDNFGIFLSGPGISGPFSDGAVNIAVLPDSETFLSINNLRPESSCPAQNEEYYIDNNGSDNQPVYDGYTTVIPVRYPVVPFQVYTMKLAVADVSDGVFDTGVFLQFSDAFNGFSEFFNPQYAALPESDAAVNVALDLSATDPSVFPLEIEIAGTAENGTDYTALESVYTLTADNPVLDFDIQPIIDEAAEGIESIELRVSSGGEYLRSVYYYLSDEFSAETQLSGFCDENPILFLSENGGETYEFTANVNAPISSDGINTVTESALTVSGVPFQTVFSPSVIKEICIDIEHDWLDDIDVYLVAPDGKRLTLTSDNGGNGDNYTGTCFSPAAAQKIYGSAENVPVAPAAFAPFTGQWLPEGNWEYLQGSPVNGTWTLLVKDDAEGFSGTLNGWNIIFQESILPPAAVTWSTGETGLSIEYTGEIPATVTAELSAPFSGTYTFEITENNGGSNTPVSINESFCDDASFLLVNGNIYDIDNPTGTEVIPGGALNGCDSVINVSLTFYEAPDDAAFSAVYSPGGVLTIGDTEIDAPGNYIVPETDENGCDLNLYVSYLPGVAPPPANIAFPNILLAVECEGTNYCFDVERAPEANVTIEIDGEIIGTPADFSSCYTVPELRFVLPPDFYAPERLWQIESIGTLSGDYAGVWQGAETLERQLNFEYPEGDWHLRTVGAETFIYTRTVAVGETIILTDVNGGADLTLNGTPIDVPTGAEISLTGAENILRVSNQTNEQEIYALAFENTIETSPEVLYAEEILESGQNTVVFEYAAAPDELCDQYVTVNNVCPGTAFSAVNIQPDGAGINVTATLPVTSDLPNPLLACFEFCDAVGTCDTVITEHTILILDGTTEADISGRVLLSPNPTQGAVYLSISHEDFKINKVKIFDAAGKMMSEVKTEIPAFSVSLDLSDFGAGIYFIEAETTEGIVRKRVVKE